MTSFAWKRRAGGKIIRDAVKTFEADAKEDEDEAVTSGEVDWITLAPQRKVVCLEDALIKSDRLRQEGSTLAEAQRFWEAISKWEEALHLTPDDEKLHEMKAQAYMTVGEVFPAILSAQKSVSLNPLWWVAHQTLGRAQLGLGDVHLALKSFSRAVHLNPAEEELRDEDLMWAVELIERKKQTENELQQSIDAEKCRLVELDNEDWTDSESVSTQSVSLQATSTNDESVDSELNNGEPVNSLSADTQPVSAQQVNIQSVYTQQVNAQPTDATSIRSSTVTPPIQTIEANEKRRADSEDGFVKYLPTGYVCMR